MNNEESEDPKIESAAVHELDIHHFFSLDDNARYHLCMTFFFDELQSKLLIEQERGLSNLEGVGWMIVRR